MAKLLYPVFLNLEGRLAVIIGGGKVALRKARGLLECGARVRVVSPAFDPAFDALQIERVERPYQPGDLAGAFLAFAATNRRDINHQVALHAAEQGTPANVADSPDECVFIVPARATAGDVQLAVSTGGADPRKAASIRTKLASSLREDC